VVSPRGFYHHNARCLCTVSCLKISTLLYRNILYWDRNVLSFNGAGPSSANRIRVYIDLHTGNELLERIAAANTPATSNLICMSTHHDKTPGCRVFRDGINLGLYRVFLLISRHARV
jgi:hypothetical protein